MDAIRKFIELKDNTFEIKLPDSFTAKRVEVIILPSDHEGDIPEWHKDIIDKRLQEYIEHPSDAMDFDTFCEEIEKGYEKL